MGIGVIALGIFVGWICRYVLTRLPKFSVGVIGAIVTAVLGAAVLNLFDPAAMADLFWFYPIGLLIGFVIGTVRDGR